VEHYVNRERGTIYLEPIINTLNKIEKQTDIVVSELAIKSLQNEIEEIEEQWVYEMREHKENLADVGVFGLFLKINGKSKQEYDRINDKYSKVIKQKLADIEKHKKNFHDVFRRI
jgi:vacuolar-type H+-ATPase subunit F/Vma7